MRILRQQLANLNQLLSSFLFPFSRNQLLSSIIQSLMTFPVYADPVYQYKLVRLYDITMCESNLIY